MGKNLQLATSGTAIAKLKKAVEKFKNENVRERGKKRKIQNASDSFNESKKSRTSNTENSCSEIPNSSVSETSKNDEDSISIER